MAYLVEDGGRYQVHGWLLITSKHLTINGKRDFSKDRLCQRQRDFVGRLERHQGAGGLTRSRNVSVYNWLRFRTLCFPEIRVWSMVISVN